MGCLLLSSPSMSVAQEVRVESQTVENEKNNHITYKGYVYDAATKSPLLGVKVQAYDNSKYSSMTDESGMFEIVLPKYITSLGIEMPGYNFQQVGINNSEKEINIYLFESVFPDNYTQFTSAINKKTVLANHNNTDLCIDDQIQNILGSDIRAINRSGVPGIGAFMYMNGINSLNTNVQPLIVLDGVIMDMPYSKNALHDGFYNNILSNISVDDIESVSVLKNGSAIYGAKGANGVLMINTRRNKSMVTKIDIHASGKFQMLPTLPDMMNADQYRIYVSELLGTTGSQKTDYKFLNSNPEYYYYKKYHNNTDWSKEVYQNAFIQNYAINVQGGDEIANYNLSVGFAQGDATEKSNNFNRFNLRLNSDISLTDNLLIKFDASYSDVNRKMRDIGIVDDVQNSIISSPGFLSLIKSPFLSPYALDTQGNFSSFYEGADDYLDEALGSEASLANPSSILEYGEGVNKNKFGNRFITLSIRPEYKFKNNLTIGEHFSFIMTNTDENYYLPLTGVPSFEIEGLGWVKNTVKAMSSHQYLITSDSYIDWYKRYYASTWSFKGGFRFVSNQYKSNYMIGYNSSNDKSPNMSSSLAYKQTSGENDNSINLTYYLTGNYSYKDIYYINAGVSMQASSLFGLDAKDGIKMCGVSWGLFPSVTGSWVISSETWFNKNRYVNYLKANVGFDVSGNDDINSIASRTYFSTTKILDNINGLTISNIGNNTLQWESTKRFTAGVNMNLFNNYLNISGNFFKSKTDNLLSLRQLSYISGLEENWSNGGSLENIGYDVSFNLKVVNSKNWKIDLGASVGSYKNKLTSLPNNKPFITQLYGSNIISQIGSPVGLFYGYKTDGVISTSEEANSLRLAQLSYSGQAQQFKAGDMKFVDSGDGKTALDKDGNICTVIDKNDMVVIGDPNPDIYGNIFANINYKNWSLNAVFSYCYGNDIYNYQRSILEGGSYFYNQTTALNKRWISEGQKTDIPQISYEDKMGNSRFSDRWIEDGSYIRLKRLTLSYNCQINSLFLQGITIYGAADNLFTATKYLGPDPEFSPSNMILSQGIDRGLLPQSRTFSIGVKINL